VKKQRAAKRLKVRFSVQNAVAIGQRVTMEERHFGPNWWPLFLAYQVRLGVRRYLLTGKPSADHSGGKSPSTGGAH
jgi:hypothetical protein